MISPQLLKNKDKALIVAPAGVLPTKGIDVAIKRLQQWGLEVALADNVYSTDGVFAGSDIDRLSGFQKALDDPSIKLILCARGGYGFSRFLDKLSYFEFNNHPKWVVGFSDITAFHLDAYRKGVLTIHGPMATSFDRNGGENSIIALQKLLFKGESIIEVEAKQLSLGNAEGQLVGGNLALICDSLGTQSEINTDGKILVLEDVGEYYYRIDRLLNQLARAGKLSKLKGLVLGSFSDMINGEVAFTETVEDMIGRLTENLTVPIAVSMPIGHEPENFPFVHGAQYSLIVKENSARLEILTKL